MLEKKVNSLTIATFMAVPYYHEQMHTAIWTWIREYSNSPTLHEHSRSPIRILMEIIEKISCTRYTLATAPYYLSPTVNVRVIGTFSEQMRTVAEHLHRTGQQQRISWYDMERILKYYLSDAKEYWNYINSLNWSHHQVNSYFGLNLHDISQLEQRYMLIWDRYLTGTRIFHPTENPLHSGEMFVIEQLARGEEYWGPRVSEDIFGIQEEVRFYNPGEQEGDEETSKKKEALKKIQTIVDEVSNDLGDGGYLKLMNVMKELWQS